ncbi:hypothetical protein EYC98_00040 [Halieaceae bacterium IMCC14734]|uniref:Uncharacterized protein n=1 Tax=Candidatus Litorirhabdus singularis TaxID=2518993 RepID=A0ABT3TAC4_9GAMM|nr:hypothetical protein [Candidatus Litorirhabdus singularis]MCX2979251.1 hypothetical protein [Candidatus Litorirhabdus singularis]
MKTLIALPLIIAAHSATAGIVPDANAFAACEARFERVNRDQELGLERAATHRAPGESSNSYRYYFNAYSGEDNWRVECHASRVGKIREFAVEPGSWVFEASLSESVAGY